MNLDDLTIGNMKEINAMFSHSVETKSVETLNAMIGKKVIVRTYSAGNWFGTLDQKAGNEVILKNARRICSRRWT